MSSSMITIAIIGIVLFFLLVVFLLQMRERMRDERDRQKNALVERLRRMRRILDELPPPYIAKPIRICLLERIIEIADELRTLDKSRDFTAEKEQAALELELVSKNPQPTEGQAIIQDEQQAMEIRKLLKNLHRFIEGEKHDGRLDAKTAIQNMAQTAFLIARSIADLYVTKAQAAIENHRYRIAIDQYHNAIESMEKAQGSPLAQQCIVMYRKKVKELDRLASEETASQSHSPEVKAVVERDENGNLLSSEWDRVISEQDTWKKKQAYDD